MNGLDRVKLPAFSAVAALVAGLTLTFVGDVADAAPTSTELDPTTRSIAKPKPPPTKVKKHAWGASVGAKQTNRMEKKTAGAGKASTGAKSRGSHPLLRQTSTNPADDDTQPFRLNISLCGFRGPNTANMTRCLPAMEDDVLPDEPGRPEVSPSMAVRVRVPRPEDVRWGEVLAESKNVLFPKLHVKVQPTGRTLVNLETIVYTDESRVYTDTVTVLGFPVAVEAMPMSYTWRFGDGASVTTTTPGRPYPAKDITHKYMKKAGVQLTLTTNYAARFNVAGTGWQYVEGVVPITGPATALRVREAVPVLVEPGR
ncbi:hypothetical protein OHA70_17065 [Kribbella sp. NBC_00382]|uniref:hypothetical protein n=1 Tax=Kribbella sp. NBC_00382 TaxID=2975967 RepID=UPI002E1B6290